MPPLEAGGILPKNAFCFPNPLMLFFMNVLVLVEESYLVDNGSGLASSSFCKCYVKSVIFHRSNFHPRPSL
jgi:hypothetical protein